MDNEAQVVQSMAVAVPAARALHADVPAAKLVKRVTVTVPANTTVLDISCSAGTAIRASQCANAFANAYLSAREAAAKGKTGFAATQLQKREQSLQNQTQNLVKRIRRLPPNSPLKPGLRTQLKNTGAVLRAVRGDIASVGTSVNYDPGTVITAASPPSAATGGCIPRATWKGSSACRCCSACRTRSSACPACSPRPDRARGGHSPNWPKRSARGSATATTS
jgi:hypothetical protein